MTKIDRNQQQRLGSNIVLHDGGHRGLGANRGPSCTLLGQQLLSVLLRLIASNSSRSDAWAPAVRPM